MFQAAMVRLTRIPTVCVVLMAALAACRGSADRSAQETTAPIAEQIIVGVRTTLTDSLGLRKGFVVADSAFVRQEAREVEFRRLTATLFDERGEQAAVLTGAGAIYSIAAGTLEVSGAVTVAPTRGGRLSTSRLRYDIRTMRFDSDSSYSYQGTDGPVGGTGFSADLRLRNLTRAATTPSPR